MKLMLLWVISVFISAFLPSTVTTKEQIALKRSGSGGLRARRRALRARPSRRE